MKRLFDAIIVISKVNGIVGICSEEFFEIPWYSDGVELI